MRKCLSLACNILGLNTKIDKKHPGTPIFVLSCTIQKRTSECSILHVSLTVHLLHNLEQNPLILACIILGLNTEVDKAPWYINTTRR